MIQALLTCSDVGIELDIIPPVSDDSQVSRELLVLHKPIHLSGEKESSHLELLRVVTKNLLNLQNRIKEHVF